MQVTGRAMKDVVEALARILADKFGLQISSHYLPYLIVAAAIGPWLVGGYLSIRRWRGDFRAISGELEAAAKLINNDTKRELNGAVRKFTDLHQKMQGALFQKMDSLHLEIRSTRPIEAREHDEDIAEEKFGQTTSRPTKLRMAESVRDTVLDRWLLGTELKRTDIDGNCFEFSMPSHAGQLIRIFLQTPYRESVGRDGRMPYTLEIWADGYKKMNFEWDMEGNYALRGFKKGEWIEDVAEWHFGAQAEDRDQAAA